MLVNGKQKILPSKGSIGGRERRLTEHARTGMFVTDF